MVSIPSRYPNPKRDDPWDNHAVHWLLEQEGAEGWTRHNLMECLRHQPARLKSRPQMVAAAESFARRHGVRWVEEPYRRRTIHRLYRADLAAPHYPTSPEERNELVQGWKP